MNKAFGAHPFPITALSDISCRFYQGINTVADKVKYVSEGYPIIQAKHITGNYLDLEDVRYTSSDDFDGYKEKYRPQKDDILFSNIGTIGKSCVVSDEVDFLIAWNVFLITTTDDANSKYINYLLEQLDQCNYYDDLVTGNATKFINKTTLGAIELPFPPLPEQQKIAAILSSVDEVIEKTQAQIDKLKDLKTGMMQELLSPREGSKQSQLMGYTEFKDSPMGRIPVGWDVVDLFSASEKIKRGPSLSCNVEGRGIRYVTSGSLVDGRIDLSKDVKHLEGFDKVETCLLSDGDFILNCVNSAAKIGGSGIYRSSFGEAIVGFNNYALELNSIKFLSSFVNHFSKLHTFTLQIQNILKPAINQVSFSTKDLKSIFIPMPDLPEQKAIAEKLDSVDDLIECKEKHVASVKRTKKALMQDLLTGKVRVKINEKELVD